MGNQRTYDTGNGDIKKKKLLTTIIVYHTYHIQPTTTITQASSVPLYERQGSRVVEAIKPLPVTIIDRVIAKLTFKMLTTSRVKSGRFICFFFSAFSRFSRSLDAGS